MSSSIELLVSRGWQGKCNAWHMNRHHEQLQAPVVWMTAQQRYSGPRLAGVRHAWDMCCTGGLVL